jgi:hypothetical protein
MYPAGGAGMNGRRFTCVVTVFIHDHDRYPINISSLSPSDSYAAAHQLVHDGFTAGYFQIDDVYIPVGDVVRVEVTKQDWE